MNKENKLVPGLPSGFEDRWDKKLLLKKKLLKAIENNFIKFGAEALETPSFEISENIGSFLAEDDSNPMSDVFSFQDGEKKHYTSLRFIQSISKICCSKQSRATFNI
jgi:histidyl-tRNA synthetase